MRKYYLVLVKSSMHTFYDQSPKSETKVYGIYQSRNEARKGLQDSARIEESYAGGSYIDEMYNTKTRIVNDEDLVVIIAHTRDTGNEKYYRTEMITISIEETY